MVRFVIFLLFVNVAFADVLGTVRTFVSSKTYHEKKDFIKSLFVDEAKFLDQNGSINTLLIANTLKENGLLNLTFADAKMQSITFEVNENPLLFLKITNDILEQLGYTYYLTKQINKRQNSLLWTININTQTLIDPSLLANSLKKRYCKIININKTSALDWIYKIDAKDAKLNSEKLILGRRVELKRPDSAYWVKVDQAKEVQISANIHDTWYAKVIFFDSHLNPISELSPDEKSAQLSLQIPQNSYYMYLDDQFSLSNIKHGLAIRLN